MLIRHTIKQTNITSPAEKLAQIFSDTPDVIAELVANFKRVNPNITCWDDLKLQRAYTSTLDKPNIDPTIQRPLIEDVLTKNINEFADYKVDVIKVFEDAGNDDELLTWDGQHTLLTLYFIAIYVFEQDPAECEIPIAIHPSKDRKVVRKSFKSSNRDDKNPLSDIDYFEQDVYSYRDDGDKTFKNQARKQDYLDQYGLFLVNHYESHAEDFGALTRSFEIVKTTISPAAVEAFCMWRKALGCKAELTQPKEMVLIFAFVALCKQDKIEITQAYMNRLAKVCKKHFNADFFASSKSKESGEFLRQAKEAYLNWHAEEMKGKKEEERTGARFVPDDHGISFFLQQLDAVKFKGVPKQEKAPAFIVQKQDEWK